MVFCFVQNFFFRQHKSQNIYLFFQNLILGYMTKTLNQIIFFFLHQNQNIYFSNIGNQNIFLEKNHNPPLPFKLNGRSLTLLEHMSLPLVLSGVHVTRSLVQWVCFVDRCLPLCTFSFGHCNVCSSSIYGLLITPLLSSNSSCPNFDTNGQFSTRFNDK